MISSVVDASGKKLFSAYLLHSLPCEMSAIQLFHGNRMAVVSHLVSSDTIGEIGDPEFLRKPWRAMLIKVSQKEIESGLPRGCESNVAISPGKRSST